VKKVAESPRDSRSERQIVEAILYRRPGYLKLWQPTDVGPGRTIVNIAARYLQSLIQRRNQVYDKNKLAFLDQLGLELVPARSARAPIVFTLSEDASAAEIPKGTGLAAAPRPGDTEQVAFESENALGLAAGKLVEVYSLWPGRDEYIDHSQDYADGKPIRPLERSRLRETPHYIYMSHPTLLELSGSVEVGVHFELTQGGSESLDIVWEYWDGKVWRLFRCQTTECLTEQSTELDGTNGLTHSGTYTLKADCASAAEKEVDEIKGFWIRGRLTEPLPVDPDRVLPEVSQIQLSNTTNRPLTPELTIEAINGTKMSAAELSVRVRNETGEPLQGATVIVSNPDDPNSSDIVFPDPTDDNGVTRTAVPTVPSARFEFQVTFQGLTAAVRPERRTSLSGRSVDLTLAVGGIVLDSAFADGTELDVTKPFYPFGLQPQPGSTFYFTSKEAFGKPGARVRVYLPKTSAPQNEMTISDESNSSLIPLPRTIEWEYWNGRRWVAVAVSSESSDPRLDFEYSDIFDLTVPIDMSPVEVNDKEELWMRARLVRGGFGSRAEVSWDTNKFYFIITQPPVLADCRLGYAWEVGPFHAEHVLSFNDFSYEDNSEAARWPGSTFKPVKSVQDITPTLYLGFEKKFPVAQIGLYLDVKEEGRTGLDSGETNPALMWEYRNGSAWRELAVKDESNDLAQPGILSFIAADDSAAFRRFDQERYWIRARLKEDGPPAEPELTGIYLNAVWASQRRTLTDVPVGRSVGLPNAAFVIPHIPVLDGERVEVCELWGRRADVEWRILALEMADGDMKVVRDLERKLSGEGTETDVIHKDMRLRRDRNKRVIEVWIRWRAQDHFYFSQPEDRHYVLQRATGRLFFGDGTNGRIPPPGAAILARQLTTGGGRRGNAAVDTITQLLGPASGVSGVTNPRAAEGGSDGEPLTAFIHRGPQTVRHRGRATLPSDYETMAREASSAVAVARCLPAVNPAGRTMPGWVTVQIIPHSADRRPWPSAELRLQVRRYIEDRAPAVLKQAGRVHVTGPQYRAVDVAATIAPVESDQAETVENRAREALERFLHPLLGGQDGTGWGMGRDVFISDVAAMLERVEGLNYVSRLELLDNGVPQGERLVIRDAFTVTAGVITLKIEAPEA
jgi:hypothetical protein